MEEKFIYVISVTFANFGKCSVNSIIAGHSDNKDDAVSILKSEYECLLKEGYSVALFSHTKWGWKYISDDLVISGEIHVLK